jgi:large subunit ribosomal protein L10
VGEQPEILPRTSTSDLIVFVPLRLFAAEVFFMSVSSSVEVKSHMPNAKVLSEKQAIVEALAERIRNAGSGILVDYKGITVEEDTALRTEMRKESVNYTVVKNTLTRKALDSLGMEGLDHVLNGTTSLATTESDPIAPFRIITDYSKKLGDRFNVKAAFMEGKILSEQEIAEISELPGKDALYAKVLGTMIAPITGLAVCLGQILEQMGGSVETPEAAE